jgi:uncharacterized membrane protein SpoIIM required for sporulation
MMVLNGLLLGVVGAATWHAGMALSLWSFVAPSTLANTRFTHAGMALSLWSFVAPHGALEIPAIFIAGGAGFEIARGMLFPGLLPRRDALALAGGRASQLVLGSVPLLLIAGSIEGFFSPTAAPVVMKFLLGGLLGAALLAWLFGAGRTIKSGSGLSPRDIG